MTAADLPADFFSRHVAEVDPEIADLLESELHRQETTLEMIASENFVPQAVLDCQGSVLTNKYAEGYPGRRYYGGCGYVDAIEAVAIARAEEGFGGGHAKVRPHARAPTNTARSHSPVSPPDTRMGTKRCPRGRLSRPDQPRRHDHGHEARPGRPSLARHEAERVGPALQRGRLWRRSGELARQHGGGRARGRGVPAEDHHRRLVRLSAPARLR